MPKKIKSRGRGKKVRHGSYGSKGGGSSEYLKALEEAAKDPDENEEHEAIFKP